MMFRKFLSVCICLSSLCLLVTAGCERRRATKAFAVVEDDPEYIIAVLMDLSKSFEHEMTEGGEAYQYLMSLVDRYFRGRIGTNDQLILAQISATPDRTFLWQGTPMELRQQFPNPQSFSAFLKSKASPQRSHVHDAIVQTVDYMLNEPSVANRKAQAGLFVLSDMVDSSPNAASTRAKAIRSLRALNDVGGTFGFYFVDQTVFPIWQRELKAAEIDVHIAPDFRKPPVPNFE